MEPNYRLIADYYERHLEEMRHYVTMMLEGDAEAAEDIVQDVVVVLLRQRQLLMETTLPALIHVMLRQRVINHRKRQTIARHYQQQEAHRQCMADDTLSLVSAWDLTNRLEHRMAKMEPASRDVIQLHILEGCKVADISKQLHMNYKTVEYKLGLARKEIRQYAKAVKYA